MKNKKIEEQVNAEFSRLSKGYKALTIDHKKEVLKTARGLLNIQRAYKTTLVDKARHVDFTIKGKNG